MQDEPYIVVIGHNLLVLQNRASMYARDQGYKPTGGPFWDEKDSEWCQAMYRAPDKGDVFEEAGSPSPKINTLEEAAESSDHEALAEFAERTESTSDDSRLEDALGTIRSLVGGLQMQNDHAKLDIEDRDNRIAQQDDLITKLQRAYGQALEGARDERDGAIKRAEQAEKGINAKLSNELAVTQAELRWTKEGYRRLLIERDALEKERDEARAGAEGVADWAMDLSDVEEVRSNCDAAAEVAGQVMREIAESKLTDDETDRIRAKVMEFLPCDFSAEDLDMLLHSGDALTLAPKRVKQCRQWLAERERKQP